MKQRFSSLDVKIIAHELSEKLVTLRVSNVYDLSSRIFLIKFARPEHREQLIIDSGYRCHLSSFARSTAAAPSAFVTRLRKFIRTRRVTAVTQVGTDRVIDVTFSDGLYHLFLEFYAGGNIILTDGDFKILALLRIVNEGAEHEQFRVGVTYDLNQRQNYGGVPPITRARVKEGIEAALLKSTENEAQNKKFKRREGDALRRALAVSITEYPPVLLEHGLNQVGLDKTLPPSEILADETLFSKLMASLDAARTTVEGLLNVEQAKGYILAKKTAVTKDDSATPEGNENQKLLYDDFHPFKPAQFAERSDLEILEFDGFNRTVDEFFSSIEGQKLESRLQEREENAKRKLQHARNEHDKRIDGLQQVQELNVLRAQAIEANLDRVEEARAAVNGLIAQGMDWQDIEKLIKMEQVRHNAVAETIKLPLKLHENTATLLLAGYGAEDEDEDDFIDESDSDASEDEEKPSANAPSDDKRIAVDIDLSQSAWANSRHFYENRRTAASKQERTVQASKKALKSRELKITADLKKGLKQEKQVLRPVRIQMWFEKFIWFISSDGYLVLCGKDAQQSEILYSRYLKKGDIYLHAELQGAATVVIKNNPATPDAPIPPSTLSQAGNLSVCTSSAWDSKAVMSAYWVNADQVSKTAQTGEYLATGVFTIRGKKNFLPPAQLLLGFAVVFQISEESKLRHKKHRLEHVQGPEQKGDEKAEATADGDDDFPDAGDAVLDDDDDFPDAISTLSDEGERPSFENAENDSSDEVDARSIDHNESSRHGGIEEDEFKEPRSNPLQNNGVNHFGNDTDDSEAGDNNANDLESDHEKNQAEGIIDAQVSRPKTTNDQPFIATDGVVESVEAPNKRYMRDPPKTKASSYPSEAQQHAKPYQPARGKRGKAKKIASKYADQTDEDRELAMSLLGSRKAATADDSATTASATETRETAEAARARRREQHLRRQKEGLEAEALRKLKLEDGIAAVGSNDRNKADDEDTNEADHTASLSSLLDGLVGTPLPDDEILEAVPVCAPWTALGRYKYRAKLQPGAQKKGKAVREVLGRWIKDASEPRKVDQSSRDAEKIWPREAELIRAWKEAEVLGVVPVKSVRVMMGGGGDAGKGKGGGSGKGKGGGRGGRGSKKGRG